MSSLRSFFSRKPKEPEYPVLTDFSALGTDLHSHLIPGIDDGVADLDESIAMIRAMADLGYRKLITTPHIMSDFFRNTPEIILDGLKKVNDRIAQARINITLEAAAEYYVDEKFLDKVQNEKMLTISGKYLLFEISYINPPDNIYNIIFELNVHGYIPLLAHPERYPFWYGNLDEYKKLKEIGALFQLNINSLTGYYGPGAKKAAEQLIDENMIDFLGSDLHGARHLEGLRKVVNEKYFWKVVALGVKNSLL